MKAVIGLVALGLAGTAYADSQQLQYMSTLSGSLTYLTEGNNAVDPRATYATIDATGALDISLIYSEGKLVDYDISMYLSNGVSITKIATDSFFEPAFLTSTGTATCTSHSEITGCITLNGSSAIIDFATSTAKGGSFALSVGPAGETFKGSVYICGGDVTGYEGRVTNSQHLCSVGLTGSAGQWSSKTVAAPELDGAGLAGGLTLAGAAFVLLGNGRRRSLHSEK